VRKSHAFLAAVFSIVFLMFPAIDAFSAAPAGIDYAYDKESSASNNKIWGNVQVIPPGATDIVSVDTWLNIESYTSDWMNIFTQNQTDANPCCTQRLWFGIYGPNATFHVGTQADTSDSVNISSFIPVGIWTHVVLTLAADSVTNNLKIYVNGVLRHQDTLFRASSANLNGFAIGTNVSGSHRFDGRFDNFKVWNNVLTPTQIQESRFAYGSEGVSGSPTLRAFYDFDEGSQTTVNDRTGNGYNLAISNSSGTTQDAFVNSTREKAILYDNQSATTPPSGGTTTFFNGSTITSIPTTPPQRTSFTFAGWFTAASGGTQITNGSSMPNNREATVVLYAQWTDSSPPIFSSASVGSSGTTITMTYAETLSSTTAAASRFTITATGNSIPVASVTTSGSTVTINLSSTIFVSQSVLLSYADPSGSNDANAIQDLAGNDASTLTNQAVTNSSTQKQNQSITLNAVANKTYGDAPFVLSSSDTTTSGLAINYSVDPTTSATCQISVRTVTVLAAGTCTIKANQEGNSNFNAATQVQQSFTASAKAITIKSSARSTVYTGSSVFGLNTFTLTVGSLVGSDTITSLTYTYSSASLGYNSPTAPTTAGSYVISPSAANFSVGSANNYSITYETSTLIVARASQSIFSLSSTSGTYLTNLRLTTSGGSDTGTVSFEVSNVGTAGCFIANSDSLTSTTAGTCQVVATKLGTTNYLPAYDTQTVTLGRASLELTISVSGSSTIKYGSVAISTFTTNRVLGSGGVAARTGTLSYSASGTACSINSSTGSIIMVRASGSCAVQVSLENDSNYSDTSSASVILSAAKADAITVSAADKTSVFNGSASTITPTYSVSGLQLSDTVTVTYGYMGLSNGGDIYAFVSDKPSLAGSYSIIPMVSQTNSDSYTASATITSGTLTITRATRTLSPSTYSKTTLKYGESATVTSNTTSPSTNSDGEFSYSVGSGCTIDSGSGTVTAANYQGTCSSTTTIEQGNNYESATATAVSFSLSKADTITVAASSPSAVTYTGSAAVTPTVLVSGLVMGDSATGATFSYSRAPNCAAGGTCQVGDIGPGGGKVFYVSGTSINSLPGISSGGIYLEMAPSTFSKTTYNWCEGSGNPYTTLFGASATTIGSGAANTKIMIDNCTGGAGVQAANLTLGGKSDWFLPSYNELVEIYNLRTMLGLGTGKYASTYLYWSSTEGASNVASSLVPWAGVGGQNKAQAIPYLPIRAFSPSSSTYESPLSSPTNAGTYRIAPSALTLSGGVTTDYYLATVYETGTFTINKAAQTAFTNYSTLSGVFGIALPVIKFGGSGDGAESIETTNGSATGCAFSGTLLTATAAGTCSVSASKDLSENYTQSDSVFSVNFDYYVPASAPPVSTTPTQIAVEAKNNWGVNASVGPTITGISPSSGPVGTVVTITGTGMNGVDVIKIGRRNLTSVTGVSETSVTGVIPAGASSGPIFVSNSLGSHFFPSGFTVTP
jgi:uncharacterized repeat protein (TIGR02543 family)